PTSPPASRTASTAFIAEPPVVVTSSTITTRLPCRLSPLARPSTASLAPCSFGFLRTKNAAIGWPLIQEICAIAPASGTAPIPSPADEVEWVVPQRLVGQFREQRRALGVEHGRLQVEIEIALAARGQRDIAPPERALADDLGETGAGGGFGHGNIQLFQKGWQSIGGGSRPPAPGARPHPRAKTPRSLSPPTPPHPRLTQHP